MVVYFGGQNQVQKFRFEYEDDEKEFKLEGEMGDSLGAHSGPVRGVTLSNNDYLMATYSFDSIKVWEIDFNSQ
jgi:hypothetical protein